MQVRARDFAIMCDTSLHVVHMGVLIQKNHIGHTGSGDISMKLAVLGLTFNTMVTNSVCHSTPFSPVMLVH